MKNVHRGAVIGGKALDAGMMGAAALGQAELLPEMMVARKVVNGLEKLSKEGGASSLKNFYLVCNNKIKSWQPNRSRLSSILPK